MKLGVVVTAWNAAPWVEECLETVVTQSVHPFVLLVDDGSTDDTLERARPYVSGALHLGRNQGAAHALRAGVDVLTEEERFGPEDVVAWVGADDRLAGPGVLEAALALHRGGAWVTYGNAAPLLPTGNGSALVGDAWTDRGYRHHELRDGAVRRVRWRACPLQTFRVGCYRAVPDRELQYADGTWLRVCCDLALMFPLLELARTRSVFLPEVVYHYRRTPRGTLTRWGTGHKREVNRWLRSLPSRSPLSMLS